MGGKNRDMADRPRFACYDCQQKEAMENTVLAICEALGLDVDDAYKTEATRFESSIGIPYRDWQWEIGFRYNTATDSDTKGVCLKVDLRKEIDPSSFDDEAEYVRWMDLVYNLGIRLSMSLETAYTPLYDAIDRSAAVRATGRPFSEYVEAPPLFGVFSEQVLNDFGGVDELYDEPWYVATLTDGRTVVTDSHSLWSGSGWEPPIEATFIERAELRPDSLS